MINEQSLKDRLHTIAKTKGSLFNACWKQLLLERFLVRVVTSPYSDKFIFKGGFLLAYILKTGRETVDLDFLLTKMTAEKKSLEEIFKKITNISLEDGFSFLYEGIKMLSQPHMNYPGYRITLKVCFAKMKDKIHVDIGMGDEVDPLIRKIELVNYRGIPLFEDSIALLSYPTETIFAEKLETILSKGPGNSRMKDYHDLIILIRNKNLMDLQLLKQAVSKTFLNRDTTFSLIQFDESSLQNIQKLWASHLKGLGNLANELNLPKHISQVIEKVNRFIITI